MSETRYEIPKGLEISGMTGEVEGSLIISGHVRDAKIRANSVVITENGSLTRSEVRVGGFVLQGKMSDTKTFAKTFVAAAGSVCQDATIGMQGYVGVAIDEKARLEGDVIFNVTNDSLGDVSPAAPVAEAPVRAAPAAQEKPSSSPSPTKKAEPEEEAIKVGGEG